MRETTPGRASAATTPAFAGVGRPGMTWPPTLPFDRVLERAKALDKTALSMLYKRFLPVVYRYTLARVADIHQAEDITADTFIAVVEHIATTRASDELGFAAWLLGIARNKVAMYFRQRRGQPPLQHTMPEDAEPVAGAEGDDPLTIITARESWSEVVRALNLLTEEQRTVVLYRCVLGYPADDVARLMEKQPGTIRALQFRALASLARHLGLDRDNNTPSAIQRGKTQPRTGTQIGMREGRWGDAPRG